MKGNKCCNLTEERRDIVHTVMNDKPSIFGIVVLRYFFSCEELDRRRGGGILFNVFNIFGILSCHFVNEPITCSIFKFVLVNIFYVLLCSRDWDLWSSFLPDITNDLFMIVRQQLSIEYFYIHLYQQCTDKEQQPCWLNPWGRMNFVSCSFVITGSTTLSLLADAY